MLGLAFFFGHYFVRNFIRPKIFVIKLPDSPWHGKAHFIQTQLSLLLIMRSNAVWNGKGNVPCYVDARLLLNRQLFWINQKKTFTRWYEDNLAYPPNFLGCYSFKERDAKLDNSPYLLTLIFLYAIFLRIWVIIAKPTILSYF